MNNLLDHLLHFFVTADGSLQFPTITFLATFVAFYALYLLLQRSSRGLMMAYVVLFSLFFAYKLNGWLMLLLPATVVVSWYLTLCMRMKRGRKRRLWLWATVALELLPLVSFKYTNFFLLSFSSLLRANFQPLDIFLPIGISFFTFQAVSYSIDVYRQRFRQRVSLLEYSFYLTFFPLIFAGPITRAETLIPQLQNRHRVITSYLVYGGLWLIVVGLLKKAFMADYISQYTVWIFDDPLGYSGFENVIGLVAFSLQIYLDFSGYSDISIGLAALMGFRLRDNFNFPYHSTNPTEFWRRWHISLSTWFRDYVYIPLGGNRVTKWRVYANCVITMLLAGLWHGASWMFVCWGALHGIGLVVHKASLPLLKRLPDNFLVKVVAWLLFFLFLLFTWVFFRCPDMSQAFAMIQHCFNDFSFAYAAPFFGARPVLSLMLVVGYLMLFMGENTYRVLQRMFIMSPWLLKVILVVIVVQLLLNFSANSIQPFIYSQF